MTSLTVFFEYVLVKSRLRADLCYPKKWVTTKVITVVAVHQTRHEIMFFFGCDKWVGETSFLTFARNLDESKAAVMSLIRKDMMSGVCEILIRICCTVELCNFHRGIFGGTSLNISMFASSLEIFFFK